MLHTPLSGLSDGELVSQVYADEDPTWREIELAQRLELALQQKGDLNEMLTAIAPAKEEA